MAELSVRQKFGALLKRYRKRCRLPDGSLLTQVTLAEILGGINASTIGHWETGRRGIGLSNDERHLLIRLVGILHEYGGIESREDAEQLLLAGGHRPLDQAEIEIINPSWLPDNDLAADFTIEATVHAQQKSRIAPFMVPSLPPQGVFGRDDVLDEIIKRLELEHTSVHPSPLALYGMGGIGKTTLAITLGRHKAIREHFPDGILWASLGPRPSIRIVLDDWGQALGINILTERDEDSCQERLRTALDPRRALLIVDDVWEITHGQYFTFAGPQCRTVFTTRESPVAYTLATREHSLLVDVLDPEPALDLLHSLAPEAVAVDRQSAERLCARLEYLPLALTLAGRMLAIEADVPSRMQRLLQELIERREARLQLVQAEGRTGIDRENPVSLQAILGMSVERLSRIDQERFAMLSVFGYEPATWDIKAVAYVWECSSHDAEDTVSGFLQRGLVTRRPDHKYWMHSLLVDYATDMRNEMKL